MNRRTEPFGLLLRIRTATALLLLAAFIAAGTALQAQAAETDCAEDSLTEEVGESPQRLKAFFGPFTPPGTLSSVSPGAAYRLCRTVPAPVRGEGHRRVFTGLSPPRR